MMVEGRQRFASANPRLGKVGMGFCEPLKNIKGIDQLPEPDVRVGPPDKRLGEIGFYLQSGIECGSGVVGATGEQQGFPTTMQRVQVLRLEQECLFEIVDRLFMAAEIIENSARYSMFRRWV